MAQGEWIVGGTTPQGIVISPGPAGTVLTSNGTTSAPSYQTVGASSLPAGLIVMWAGLLSAIPSGWLLCDGTNGTPDLRSCFIKGAAPLTDPGATGGAATHTPSGTVSQPTFSGQAATSAAVSAGTPAGTNSTAPFTPAGTITWPVGVPTHAGITATFTGDAVKAASTTSPAKLVTANTSSGVTPVTTATGVVTITNQGTVAWPAGVPTLTGQAGTVPAQTFTGAALGTHTHSVTAIGSVSQPVFTGTAANYEPTYYALAFLMKA